MRLMKRLKYLIQDDIQLKLTFYMTRYQLVMSLYVVYCSPQCLIIDLYVVEKAEHLVEHCLWPVFLLEMAIDLLFWNVDHPMTNISVSPVPQMVRELFHLLFVFICHHL